MAKTKITDYALALESLLADKNSAETQEVFVGFLQMLYQRQELKKIPAILQLYQTNLDERAGVLTATVIHAPKAAPDSNTLSQINQFLQTSFPKKKIVPIFRESPTTKGYLIEVGGQRFDFTLAHQVSEFKKALLQAA